MPASHDKPSNPPRRIPQPTRPPPARAARPAPCCPPPPPLRRSPLRPTQHALRIILAPAVATAQEWHLGACRRAPNLQLLLRVPRVDPERLPRRHVRWDGRVVADRLRLDLPPSRLAHLAQHTTRHARNKRNEREQISRRTSGGSAGFGCAPRAASSDTLAPASRSYLHSTICESDSGSS